MSNLLVPITLEVLLINQLMRERDTFRQWRHTYSALRDFGSPEPLAFDCNIDDDRTGALLHWTLPRSLRASAEGRSGDFPLVPNRWLVTRAWEADGQPRHKSWVIESDCPQASADAASYYLVAQEVVQHWQKSNPGTRRQLAVANVGEERERLGEGAYFVNLGAATDLVEWQEQDPSNLFLTAVAPGNLEFSAYVPFNEGVFSFFDELKKEAAELQPGQLAAQLDETTLRYQVTGWYADTAQDILAQVALPLPPPAEPPAPPTPRTVANVLAALSWNLPAGPPPDALANSYYQGTAHGLRWNAQEEVVANPDQDQLEHARTTPHRAVAVANTAVDAFSTLVGTQLEPTPGYDDPAKMVELLRAFHYDLLPLLNQPNGEVLLAERVRQEWFSSWAGGTQWTIVADKAPKATIRPPADSTRPPADPANPPADPIRPPVSPPLTTRQKEWLATLNQNQLLLDEAIGELTSRQWNLNAAWWRQSYLSATGGPRLTGAPEPTPEAADYARCLAAVLEQLEAVNKLVKLVPKSAPGSSPDQQSFLAAIEKFAQQFMPPDDPLPPAADPAQAAGPPPKVVVRKLKAVAQPRFWLPGNPVVLVSHVAPATLADPNRNLTVTPLPAPARGAAPSPSALPAAVQGLLDIFLAPAPSQEPAPAWQHKWNPVYLEWEVLYTAVPFGNGTQPENGTKNWYFDGTDYVLTGAGGRPPAPQALSGRSLLSPNAQLTFKARLEQFLAHYGGPENIAGKELSKLTEEIAAIDGWEFLSQELTGFNELLTQRDTRTFRTPTGADTVAVGGLKTGPLLSQLIGFAPTTKIARFATPTQAQGLVNSVPVVARQAGEASDFPFHSIRGGQFYLSHLVLYDKFGRQLDLVVPDAGGALHADHFPLVRDAALRPTYNLSHRITAPVQLPPRLLQPARLDLLLVDHQNTTQVLGQAPDVTPVGGWLLANHLDQSLLVFAPDGSSMGEIGLHLNQQVVWTPSPHSAVLQVADIAAPQLRGFVKNLTAQGEAAFRAMLHVIDSTLWTTDPLGDRTDPNLSVLVGRPLALVTVQVKFSLYGPPLTRCDGAPADPATDITTPQFSIRFGSLESREDGVIGYFAPANPEGYTRFNSVVAPDDSDDSPPAPALVVPAASVLDASAPPAQNYVRKIGARQSAEGPDNYLNLAFDGKAQLITLLVDPRATIHATTGILPVKTLALPRRFVDPALARMEISFRVGPLLSRIKPTPAPPAPAPGAEANNKPFYDKSLSYLPIGEQNGTWSWWEKGLAPQAPWTGHALTEATTTATLGSPPATLREGYLQFQAKPQPQSEPEPAPEPEPK